MTIEERWKHIEILSDLRTKYSCFDDSEEPYYKALSVAIKALKQEPCVTMRDLSEEELKHFAEEMKKVRPQVIEQEPRWIPVSERLPKEFICDDGYVEPSDYVLVWGDHGNYGVSRYWGNRKTKTENPNSYKDWMDLDWVVQKPIAWMPLPEPYKAESEVTDADSN